MRFYKKYLSDIMILNFTIQRFRGKIFMHRKNKGINSLAWKQSKKHTGGAEKMSEDISAEELIFIIRKVGLHLTAQLELCFKEEEISGIQAYFMVYILRHHPKGTFLTELYHEIGVSKPTLSVLIKKLKQKGYLSMEENPEDIRKKKVIPTGKLLEEGEAFLQQAAQMESQICSVLNSQEKSQLQGLMQKVLEQMVNLEQKETDRRYFKREKSIATA